MIIFAHVQACTLISSIFDKAVPLNQYANDCGVAQNCQIGRNPLHGADQNNKGEKVRERREVGKMEFAWRRWNREVWK